MSLLTPTALALLALSIPILLLWMLKLRRRNVTVSSTMLWSKLLRDREANAPWQKLRRNLLLLLQLAILAALVLALARPFIPVPAVASSARNRFAGLRLQRRKGFADRGILCHWRGEFIALRLGSNRIISRRSLRLGRDIGNGVLNTGFRKH